MIGPHDNAEHPSINSLIDKEDFSPTYVKVDNAIDIIKHLPSQAYLCKADIADAFKLIPLQPSLWHLHGIQWDDSLYYYTRLVFGCRSSPKIFDNLSQALCWIATNVYGIDNILHLLDDFLTIDSSEQEGQATMAKLLNMFQRLAIPLALHKTTGPVKCLEYLGVILDTDNMQARLPTEKVERIVELMASLQNRRKVTKRELLCIIGHLNFAMQIIKPGRAFISYLLQLAHSVKQLHHRVTLNQECLTDFNMWREFLMDWNCKSFFLEDEIAAAQMELFTDAAASVGYGAYFQGHWFANKWSPEFIRAAGKEWSIALMELFPIVMAAAVWGRLWSNKSIRFLCDNEATVQILRKGRSKVSFIMTLIRKLVLTAATHNFSFTASHIPGRSNHIGDALSRLQMQRFRQLAPDADQTVSVSAVSKRTKQCTNPALKRFSHSWLCVV